MEAYGNQAAAASNLLGLKSREEPSRKPVIPNISECTEIQLARSNRSLDCRHPLFKIGKLSIETE